MSGWVGKRAASPQPVHRRAAAGSATAPRRAGGDRLGVGGLALADHLPRPLADPERCAACGLRMPCPGWRFADAFLAGALQPQCGLEEPTRVLPPVQPSLPRRRPGASIESEARFAGWLTPSE
jgi:hypothetical protein